MIKVATPLQRISTAEGIVGFAMRIKYAIDQKIITPHMVAAGVQIITGGRGVTLRPRDYASDEFQAAAENLLFSSVGISALAIDQALDDAMGSKNPMDTAQTGSLRAIIYMLRCAFAHDIAAPLWLCDYKYQRKYSIFLPQSGLLVFDGCARNNTPVSLDHIGGLEGYVEIIRLCEQTLEKISG